MKDLTKGNILKGLITFTLPLLLGNFFQVLYNTANRTQRILFAKEKRKLGMTISEIALLLHTTEKTVKKYIDIQSIST